MTAPTRPEVRLRGRRCLCRGCGHMFGSPSAFDRHQHDDGRSQGVCMPGPDGKAPRLVWHRGQGLWVTKLDRRNHDG